MGGVEGHQPQHPRSLRVLRLVFDTAALREDDFVNGLAALQKNCRKHRQFWTAATKSAKSPIWIGNQRGLGEPERSRLPKPKR